MGAWGREVPLRHQFHSCVAKRPVMSRGAGGRSVSCLSCRPASLAVVPVLRACQSCGLGSPALEILLPTPILKYMNYLLALLLPPLSILLTGRPILGLLVFPIWLIAMFFSGGLTHPMFVLLAWLIIFQSRERPGMRD